MTHTISDWFLMAPYGEHPYGPVLQCFTREAAENMAYRFHSFLYRCLRGFSRVPIYIGHPDSERFFKRPGHKNPQVYGTVKALEAREDGLWMQVKWTPSGACLMASGRYQFFSPHWLLAFVEGNISIPKTLVSVGLTNYPNIPSCCIDNQKTQVVVPEVVIPQVALKVASDTLHLRFLTQDKLPAGKFLATVQSGKRSKEESYIAAWSRAKYRHPERYESLST